MAGSARALFVTIGLCIVGAPSASAEFRCPDDQPDCQDYPAGVGGIIGDMFGGDTGWSVGEPAEAPPPAASATGDGAVRASRSFVGPHHFPPAEYAAYGIVAFPARATAATKDRYVTICHAYMATLPRPNELTVPQDQQMVTVWPLGDVELADALQRNPSDSVCGDAVDHYDLPTALYAIADARFAGAGIGTNQGPYLLAWTPSSSKGKQDVFVLSASLTAATTPQEILAIFQQWRTDIERNPALWREGWDIEKVAVVIRQWADAYGASFLILFGQGG